MDIRTGLLLLQSGPQAGIQTAFRELKRDRPLSCVHGRLLFLLGSIHLR